METGIMRVRVWGHSGCFISSVTGYLLQISPEIQTEQELEPESDEESY